jgi:hypothetical protein
VEQLSELYKEGQKTVFETVMLKKGGNIGELHMAGIQAIHAALPTESKDERIKFLENELADALDVKIGDGPTALSMLVASRDRLTAQIAEMREENMVMYAAILEASEQGINAAGRCKLELQRITRNDANLPKAQEST